MPRLPSLPTRERPGEAKILARRKIECSNLGVRLTTERKVFAGVLALAVVALGVDRLFLGGALGGPASASAVPSPAPVEPEPMSVLTPHAGAMTAIPVAKQLAALQSVTRGVDAFVPPSRWQQAIAEASAAGAASRQATISAPESSAEQAAQHFQRHQLTAILIEAGRAGRTSARALIKVALDDKGGTASRLFSPGEELDGFRLVRINAASVEFAPIAGGTSATLSLPAPIETGGITAR